MPLDELKRLLGLLTANGVTYYKYGDLELRLETVQAAPVPMQAPEPADPYVANLGPRARFPGSRGDQ